VIPGVVPYHNIVQSTTWGVVLMIGYLGFDGFTSTFQDKLFKGYNMDIYNQILYVTLCSCGLSLMGLLIQGQGMLALYFVLRHPDCLFDIMLLSLVLFNPYTESISNNVWFTSKNFKCSSYLFPSALSTFRSCNIIVCYMDRQQQLASFSSPTPFAHLGPSFLPQS
jgi:hypothetical protein